MKSKIDKICVLNNDNFVVLGFWERIIFKFKKYINKMPPEKMYLGT